MYWERLRDTVYGTVACLLFIMGVISLCRSTWAEEDVSRLEAQIEDVKTSNAELEVRLRVTHSHLNRSLVLLDELESRLDRLESIVRGLHP